ncbi:hypothetical protein ACTJKH_10130 [Microbacterium sp. 22215]|uniref:hypothetical protein n=1 Tax=Microbacterium sp. 22215 TaxID=3453893 RepID=UPI003F84C6E4
MTVLSPSDRLVEAISWWRVGLDDARAALSYAAADVLAAGEWGEALAELAGISAGDNPFVVDDLVSRVVVELDLHHALSDAPESIAIRSKCRAVLSDEMSPRQLTAWIHAQFGHRSDCMEIEVLAELDDDYDMVDSSVSVEDESVVDRRVLEIAEAVVDRSLRS